MTSIQCRTADAAFNHARITEHLISDVLARFELDGLYYIQVGFNEELTVRGQGTLEEIYIYIDSEIWSGHLAATPLILMQLSQVLSPFPGVLYTPENSYLIPPYLHHVEFSESELWAILRETGVFREDLEFSKSMVDGEGAYLESDGSASNLQGPSNSTDRKGKGRDVSEGSDDEDGSGGERGGGGNGGSNGGEGQDNPIETGSLNRDQGLKNLSIPFYSKLVIKDNKHEVLSRFTSSAVANVKVSDSAYFFLPLS